MLWQAIVGPPSHVPTVDGDNDGVLDPCDNCPGVYNPSQHDTNGNGIGDACDRICLTIQRGVLGNVLDTQVASDPADATKAAKNYGDSQVTRVSRSASINSVIR